MLRGCYSIPSTSRFPLQARTNPLDYAQQLPQHGCSPQNFTRKSRMGSRGNPMRPYHRKYWRDSSWRWGYYMPLPFRSIWEKMITHFWYKGNFEHASVKGIWFPLRSGSVLSSQRVRSWSFRAFQASSIVKFAVFGWVFSTRLEHTLSLFCEQKGPSYQVCGSAMWENWSLHFRPFPAILGDLFSANA